MKIIKKSYTRKSICKERDKTFQSRLNDLRKIFKGLLKKASIRVRPEVHHTKKIGR